MPNKTQSSDIYNAMQAKETEELLQIWQKNDHVSWRDEVFAAISEILQARLDEVPPQGEPIMEEAQRLTKEVVPQTADNEIFTEPENQPVFYDPVKVLQVEEWLKWAAYAIVLATVLGNLLSIQSFVKNVTYIFTQSASPTWLIWIISIILFIIIVGASSALLYFPLYALRLILKILMEMEFNSRGIKE